MQNTQYLVSFLLATEKLLVKAYIVWIVTNYRSFFVMSRVILTIQ